MLKKFDLFLGSADYMVLGQYDWNQLYLIGSYRSLKYFLTAFNVRSLRYIVQNYFSRQGVQRMSRFGLASATLMFLLCFSIWKVPSSTLYFCCFTLAWRLSMKRLQSLTVSSRVISTYPSQQVNLTNLTQVSASFFQKLSRQLRRIVYKTFSQLDVALFILCLQSSIMNFSILLYVWVANPQETALQRLSSLHNHVKYIYMSIPHEEIYQRSLGMPQPRSQKARAPTSLSILLYSFVVFISLNLQKSDLCLGSIPLLVMMNLLFPSLMILDLSKCASLNSSVMAPSSLVNVSLLHAISGRMLRSFNLWRSCIHTYSFVMSEMMFTCGNLVFILVSDRLSSYKEGEGSLGKVEVTVLEVPSTFLSYLFGLISSFCVSLMLRNNLLSLNQP